MNSRPRHPMTTCVAAVCSLAAGVAHAGVGARVLVQEWSPLTPDRQSVNVLVDQPNLVSDTLNRAWSTTRIALCNAIKAQLGASRAAAGQTLRDIDCNLDPNMTLDLRQNGPNVITATLTLPSNSITATSTQPTACGSECDPRFSVTASAQVMLGISVQNDPARPLVVTGADLAFANASIDSHNFAADVIKWADDNLVPFFRGKSFQTMATNAINSAQVNFAGQFNNALAGVNAQLRGPAQYVRVGLWARATRITIAFAPPEISPPANGSVSGVVRWDPAKTLKEVQSTPPTCGNIQMVSRVQTGPAPLLDPDNYSNTGAAPIRQFGSLSVSAAGDACNYTLSGVAASLPNQLTSQMAGGSRGGIVTMNFVMAPDGWTGAVVPNPGAPNHNYLVYQRIGGVANENNVMRRLRNPGDPVISGLGDPASNPANIRTRPAVVSVTPATGIVQPSTSSVVASPVAIATQPAFVTPTHATAIAPTVQPAVAPTVQPVVTPASSLSRGMTPASNAAVKTPAANAPASAFGR
jgi:hypothetical protein